MSKVKVVRGNVVTPTLPLSALEYKNFFVGVYGTLRYGGHNHRLLTSFQKIGTAWLPKYKMYTMQTKESDGHNHVPWIMYTGRECHKVLIEIYHPGKQEARSWITSLMRLDALECHPRWYTRRLITIPYDGGYQNTGVNTWVYVFEPAMVKEYRSVKLCKPHPTGDYLSPTEPAQARVDGYQIENLRRTYNAYSWPAASSMRDEANLIPLTGDVA